MFSFFKALSGEDKGTPEERLAKCQQKRDWTGMAKTYYQLGVTAMEEGDLNRAHLWLNRADTIYSADDTVCKKVGEKLADDCSERIGQLEEKPLPYNGLPAQIGELVDTLPDMKLRVWCLLSLSRLVKLGERLGTLSGCEALGKLGWAVDAVLKSFQEPPAEEVFYRLRDIGAAFYELGDSPAFWGMGNEIPVSGGAPFQVFDLNGMGVLLDLDACLDNHLKMIGAMSQGEEPPYPESGILTSTLLLDYYVRTGSGTPEETSGCKAEWKRIQDDYDFVCQDLTWELVTQRVAAYKELDILG